MDFLRRQSFHGKIERDQSLTNAKSDLSIRPQLGVREENGPQLFMCDFMRIFISANCLRKVLPELCHNQGDWEKPEDEMLMGGWDTLSFCETKQCF
jgi:hypothetical protein